MRIRICHSPITNQIVRWISPAADALTCASLTSRAQVARRELLIPRGAGRGSAGHEYTKPQSSRTAAKPQSAGNSAKSQSAGNTAKPIPSGATAKPGPSGATAEPSLSLPLAAATLALVAAVVALAAATLALPAAALSISAAAIALTDLASLVTDSVSAAGIAALPVAAALSVAEPRRHRS